MTERQLPIPDKFASCPSDGKVLDHYSGQFDSVYVLLSPFFRPTSIPMERFSPVEWPPKQELIGGAEPIAWNTVLEMSGLKTLSEIDIALRTSIGGLTKDSEKEALAQTLIEETEKNGVIHPTEGELSPFIENGLYDSLQSIGQQWLWVGDEHCTKRELLWIDDLKQGDEIPPHGCVFTPDKTILVTTHWDSHFSFLCSSRSTIERILQHRSFEGFFCTQETEVYWSVS